MKNCLWLPLQRCNVLFPEIYCKIHGRNVMGFCWCFHLNWHLYFPCLFFLQQVTECKLNLWSTMKQGEFSSSSSVNFSSIGPETCSSPKATKTSVSLFSLQICQPLGIEVLGMKLDSSQETLCPSIPSTLGFPLLNRES